MVKAPKLDDDGVPERCLSLTVHGDWGHFRRIDRSVSKQTYNVIPRPTAAGLLAAIVGAPRDSYYETFSEHESAMAISVAAPVRTQVVPILSTSTSPDKDNEHLKTAGATGNQKGVTARYPDPDAHSQRYIYEFVVDPAYRIDVAVTDDAFYADLHEHLADGRSQFAPSLGSSQCLASIDFHGEQRPERTDETSVDSTTPGGLTATAPRSGGTTVKQERTHAYMTTDEDGRKTRAYVDYAFTQDGSPIECIDDTLVPCTVGDRTVIFR